MNTNMLYIDSILARLTRIHQKEGYGSSSTIAAWLVFSSSCAGHILNIIFPRVYNYICYLQNGEDIRQFTAILKHHDIIRIIDEVKFSLVRNEQFVILCHLWIVIYFPRWRYTRFWSWTRNSWSMLYPGEWNAMSTFSKLFVRQILQDYITILSNVSIVRWSSFSSHIAARNPLEKLQNGRHTDQSRCWCQCQYLYQGLLLR